MAALKNAAVFLRAFASPFFFSGQRRATGVRGVGVQTKARAPEPTADDIARAAVATAKDVFDGSDGRLTVAYYRRLCAIGTQGVVAMNLFRAAKRSARAKEYRRGRFSHSAYDVKNYLLQQLCAVLPSSGLAYGWKLDQNTPGYEWVLYVDLPCGQVSFHSASRLDGPDYAREWDRTHESPWRIMKFCDTVLSQTDTPVT